VISEEELKEAVDLQATAWLAEKNAREFVQRIEARLLAGAKIADCEYDFDRGLQMVRSRRTKTG
jgi:hypothetical protein